MKSEIAYNFPRTVCSIRAQLDIIGAYIRSKQSQVIEAALTFSEGKRGTTHTLTAQAIRAAIAQVSGGTAASQVTTIRRESI